jgi:hypothetical protein
VKAALAAGEPVPAQYVEVNDMNTSTTPSTPNPNTPINPA